MGHPRCRRRPRGWEAKHQRPCCTLRYLACKAPQAVNGKGIPGEPKSVTIDIGDASVTETRWWAAVLAPGRGWHAGLTMGKESTFWSPWSFRLKGGPQLIVRSRKFRSCLKSQERNPSFSEALEFLNNFCARLKIEDQSHAALAAVILLPAMKDLVKEIKLPAVVVNDQPRPPVSPGPASPSAEPTWPRMTREHLDRLMAASCYSAGSLPMLLNVFYNPEIESNAVTPWLQGALAVIDSRAGNAPLVICRMLMERQPTVAFLWLGATVLGLQEEILQHARLGLTPANIVSAAWSGTLQSFIQQPVPSPVETNGIISRADQCRLLFMSMSLQHGRVPDSPWKPFGENPGVDVEHCVRHHHAQCDGHGLQYRSFLWDTLHGMAMLKTGGELAMSSCAIPGSAVSEEAAVPTTQVPVDYRGMRREDEVASQGATKTIFEWLRMGANTVGEDAIWRHEWLRDGDEYDEDRSDVESDCESDRSDEDWADVEFDGRIDEDDENGGDHEQAVDGTDYDDWVVVPRLSG
ncbi:hypothetical protein N658DRAFT_505152 [Parathielavia hyrcaniae]|uniref:Uncharacterized protein n=1 Tax=Parathielavia hyrcaniae TaxID=113614 RepID=A0AAN6Q9M8_9PEZI|nr:hypothetical protein N658DRAFT_505152 [Parathielavia hyrcaniae]